MRVSQDHLDHVLSQAECVHDMNSLNQAMDAMAESLTHKLAGKNPIFLCVVTGAIIPLGHLLTRLAFPLEVNYVHATRYKGEQQGGTLEWLAQPSCDLSQRTVVVFDDILDQGVTLQHIMDYCMQRNAKQVYSAVMVDKQVSRAPGGAQSADFRGLTVGDDYVFGFGMDYEENLRYLPGIYRLPKESS